MPELRFQGFEGEWEEKKLEDIGTLKNGINKDKESFGYGFPFVNLNDVFNSKEIQIKNLRLINSTYKEREEYNLQKGDTLFIRSSVKPSGVGLTKVIEIDLKNVVFSGFLIRFRNNNLAVNFKKFIFNSISVRKQILSLSSTSANTNINQESLKKVKIHIPCMDEQQKIGRFFSELDRQIELEEQKLELLQQQKKGYMQKIFSQELRFKDENGNVYPDWEEKKLEDIIKVNSGKDYKHLDNGAIPVYGTGGYMTSVSESLSEIDAVGIGRKGTINKPYLLEAPFWTVDTLFYCTPKKEADILFILSLFREINWKVYDESTGVPSLSKQTINKINRFVPTNKEQQKIGQFFKKIDNKIKIQKQVIELLKKRKKTLLQKMFI